MWFYSFLTRKQYADLDDVPRVKPKSHTKVKSSDNSNKKSNQSKTQFKPRYGKIMQAAKSLQVHSSPLQLPVPESTPNDSSYNFGLSVKDRLQYLRSIYNSSNLISVHVYLNQLMANITTASHNINPLTYKSQLIQALSAADPTNVDRTIAIFEEQATMQNLLEEHQFQGSAYMDQLNESTPSVRSSNDINLESVTNTPSPPIESMNESINYSPAPSEHNISIRESPTRSEPDSPEVRHPTPIFITEEAADIQTLLHQLTTPSTSSQKKIQELIPITEFPTRHSRVIPIPNSDTESSVSSNPSPDPVTTLSKIVDPNDKLRFRSIIKPPKLILPPSIIHRPIPQKNTTPYKLFKFDADIPGTSNADIPGTSRQPANISYRKQRSNTVLNQAQNSDHNVVRLNQSQKLSKARKRVEADKNVQDLLTAKNVNTSERATTQPAAIPIKSKPLRPTKISHSHKIKSIPQNPQLFNKKYKIHKSSTRQNKSTKHLNPISVTTENNPLSIEILLEPFGQNTNRKIKSSSKKKIAKPYSHSSKSHVQQALQLLINKTKELTPLRSQNDVTIKKLLRLTQKTHKRKLAKPAFRHVHLNQLKYMRDNPQNYPKKIIQSAVANTS